MRFQGPGSTGADPAAAGEPRSCSARRRCGRILGRALRLAALRWWRQHVGLPRLPVVPRLHVRVQRTQASGPVTQERSRCRPQQPVPPPHRRDAPMRDAGGHGLADASQARPLAAQPQGRPRAHRSSRAPACMPRGCGSTAAPATMPPTAPPRGYGHSIRSNATSSVHGRRRPSGSQRISRIATIKRCPLSSGTSSASASSRTRISW